MPEALKPCKNELCERAVGGSAPYCCGPCATAQEHHYEIHESGPLGHTDPCNQRWADRQRRFRPGLDELRAAADHAIPAAVDRAIDRDHSLCRWEPCSDCR